MSGWRVGRVNQSGPVKNPPAPNCPGLVHSGLRHTQQLYLLPFSWDSVRSYDVFQMFQGSVASQLMWAGASWDGH